LHQKRWQAYENVLRFSKPTLKNKKRLTVHPRIYVYD